MHPALESFLNEYKIWLKVTRDKTEDTQERFIDIQLEVSDNGYSEKISKELFRARHSLFQSNYLLMESHMRVDNIRSNYSKQDQNTIDEYNVVSQNANKLIAQIAEYQEKHEKTDEITHNI